MGLFRRPYARIHSLGGVRVMKPGDVVLVGRDATNDIVLRSSTVSRVHAKLEWPSEAGRPFVSDWGSLNGISVAGVLVQRALLATGTRVAVGRFVLRVELFNCPDDTPAIHAETPDDDRLRSPFEDRPAVSGLLLTAGAGRDLLLELERDRRTGSLRVGDHTVTLCLGQVVICGTADRRAVRAMAEAVEGATYRFEPEFTLVDDTACELRWASSLLRKGA